MAGEQAIDVPRTTGGDVEDLAVRVFAAVREEITFAYEHQPLWRDRMNRVGLRPADVTRPADLRRLPTTVKADYRTNFPAGVLVRGTSPNDPFVQRSQSSGTAGDRLLTVAHTHWLAERMIAILAANPALSAVCLGMRHQRLVRYAPPNCSEVECANPQTTMRDRLLPDGALVLPVAHDLLATPATLIEMAIAEMHEWRPGWLYADPTHLAFLIRECRRRGVRPPASCRGLVLTYTQSTGAARRQIREFFPTGTVAAELVAMSELGWLALECPAGRLHLNADRYCMEMLVGDRPARTGELADLVVTTLGDRLCPHMRYRTGDVYRVLEPCCCGSPLPAVSFEGRRRDVVMRDGNVVITPRSLDRLVDHEGIDVYQLQQLDADRFEFRYIPNPAFGARQEQALRWALEEAIGPSATIHVEATGYIPCERSGKLLSCVSSVAQAGAARA